MLKFLRKYNKWILAVFGSLLMVVFLIPQALDQLAQNAGRSGATAATINGETVTREEYEVAQRELTTLTGQVNSGGFSWVESPHHWYLLSREASEIGLVNPNSAFPSYTAVQQLLGLYGSASPASDVRLRNYGRRLFHSVDASIVVLEADAELATAEPTEDEIQAQYEAWKASNPGEGDHGFGYKLPDRFKLEWLHVDVESVRETVAASDAMDPIALYKHWTQNAARFPVDDGTGEIPDIVREDLLEELTQERLDEIAKFGSDQLRSRQRGLSETDGVLNLGDDWDTTKLGLPELGELIRERFDVALPTYEAINDRWMDLTDLADVGDLAIARTDKFGSQPFGLSDLIIRIREFDDTTLMPLQARVAGPALRGDFSGQDGDVYFYRLSAVDPTREPNSLDEVRETVVEDLKRLNHYQTLMANADSLATEARNNGLLALAVNQASPIQRAVGISLCSESQIRQWSRFGLPLQKFPSFLPIVGSDVDAISEIIDHALTLPMTGEAADIPVEQRIFPVNVDGSLAVLIVEIKQQNPVTTELYQEFCGPVILQDGSTRPAVLISLLQSEELPAEEINNAFSFDTLSSRHQYEVPRSEDEDETDLDGETEDTTQTASADG